MNQLVYTNLYQTSYLQGAAIDENPKIMRGGGPAFKMGIN